ncbi:ABC transporter ATP-binding protein [Treponema sp. OMZ 799]|uniref:ABC transporter ATP-binding protein n=1 Tax=Treponema sp. OMZ 799 TaxID=2563668 RepID=UPI0020A4A3B0|nr:ABC transporter ATP-binding protein [Treponema sp. OMZ 799]UTC77850.1 ABC transporter ATP-binding protein [Treponema sp. OMZ 799]
MELKTLIGKYKRSYIVFFTGCVLSGFGQIFMSIVMAFAIGMMQNPTLEEIKSRIGFVAAGSLIMGLSHFFIIRLSLNFKRNIQLELRKIAFAKILKKSYSEFNLKSKENYISNLVNDINLFRSDYYSSLTALITSISSVTLSYILLIYIDWFFALLVLFIALIFLFIGKLFEKPTVNLKKSVSENNEKFSIEVSNVLNGIEILKLNGVEDSFCNKTIKSIKKVEGYKQRFNFLEKFQENFFSLVGLFLRVGILAYCVKKLIMGYDLTSAALLLQLSNPVMFSSRTIFPKINKYKAAKEIYTKITKDDVAELIKTNTEALKRDPIGVKDFNFKDKIEIKNLSYTYKDKEVLKNISFEILKNKKYLIRGVSGSGKTTLINLLSKTMENYEGDIFVDGINLKDISPLSFNEKIAFIFQNVFLFEDSIKNNICLYKDYPQDKFDFAVAASGLKDFILEKKEDTILSENGKDLSGGQRQRISIARAVIKDSEILFADEASASLEESLGRQIENDLLRLDTTLIAISHRYYEGISEKYDYVIEIKNKSLEVFPAQKYFQSEVKSND